MEPCEEPYIDCDNASLGTEQLLRLLVAKLGNGDPAMRVCVSNGDAIGGPKFAHLTATVPNQTNWVLPSPVRDQVGFARNGALKFENAGGTIGNPNVTTPPQPVGTEITFIY